MSTITTTNTTALPEWYNQFAQNVLGRAYATTSEPFQTYGAARIAPFSADQQQAFQMARQNVGVGEPLVQQGAQTVAQSAQGSAASMAQPLIQQGIGTFPQAASAYMTPYVNDVVSNVGTLAARNLSENLLPQVNRTFIGGGSFGGSRSAEFNRRAVRDTQEAALRQQADLMRQGYTDAAGIFANDQARALNAAQTVGQLGVSDLYRQMQAGQTMAGIGQNLQQMRAADVGTLAGIGQQQQNLAQNSANLAYQDFQAQRDYPWLQTQRLAEIGGTLRVPTSQQQTQPGPNTTAQSIGSILSGIGTIGSLFGG